MNQLSHCTSHAADETQKESVSTDCTDSPSAKDDDGSVANVVGVGEQIVSTPPLERIQFEHGMDSATSSDECETEEEMRSLPPNQV